MYAQLLLQCPPGLNKLLVALTVVKSMPSAETKMFMAWFVSFTNTIVVQRLVKNLNRRKEGWIPVHSLQIVVGDCRFRNAKVTGII